nr:hypothetical protein GTC16762_33940 [Pigmentibacter ruber]
MIANYKSEYSKQLVEHMSKGYTVESFGVLINESKETLSNWLNTNSEFKEAERLGNKQARKWAENQPFSVAIMFYIKNRLPNEYEEIKEIILKKNKVTFNENS